MLKKLKRKFLLAALLTLIVVLVPIIAIINIMNYRTIIDMADDTLEVLMDNSGEFPQEFDRFMPNFNPNFTPETPFQSRYFSVTFEGDRITSVKTDNIAAIDNDSAVNMAKSVVASKRDHGFVQYYRFLVSKEGNTTRVIFLDCTYSLYGANDIMMLSITTSTLGILLVLTILWIISGRVLTPVIEGHEKQKRFITDAGHDIKTPITIIDADAELLEMEVGENEWLTDIKKQTARLAGLTSDLIYLSKMEEFEGAPHILFSISDIAEEVTDSFAAPARTKSISLVTNIAKNLSFEGDLEAITKLLRLLIDNAVKYSPDGSEIKINLKKVGMGTSIQISNPAPNLTDEEISHMFERFYRSDSSRSSDDGFGIGLSVVYAIVAAHKGKINAKKVGDSLLIDIVM